MGETPNFNKEEIGNEITIIKIESEDSVLSIYFKNEHQKKYVLKFEEPYKL